MRQKNSLLRSREYFFPEEIEILLEATRTSPRYGHRNYTLVLISFRHGLRVREAHELRWAQIDFTLKKIHINRVKRGQPSIHPLRSDEVIALHKLKQESETHKYVFLSERHKPLSIRSMQYILETTGKRANFDFPVHFHMLRHSCGFYLANRGIDTRAIQDYLGHTNITHTVAYTKLVSTRFDDFFNN